MCGLLLSADVEICCPSARSSVSVYREYELSALITHRRDRPAQLAHLTGHLFPSALGEKLSRADAGDLLGPGLFDTALGLAAPPALAKDQADGASEAVQVADADLCAVVGLGGTSDLKGVGGRNPAAGT